MRFDDFCNIIPIFSIHTYLVYKDGEKTQITHPIQMLHVDANCNILAVNTNNASIIHPDGVTRLNMISQPTQIRSNFKNIFIIYANNTVQVFDLNYKLVDNHYDFNSPVAIDHLINPNSVLSISGKTGGLQINERTPSAYMGVSYIMPTYQGNKVIITDSTEITREYELDNPIVNKNNTLKANKTHDPYSQNHKHSHPELANYIKTTGIIIPTYPELQYKPRQAACREDSIFNF